MHIGRHAPPHDHDSDMDDVHSEGEEKEEEDDERPNGTVSESTIPPTEETSTTPTEGVVVTPSRKASDLSSEVPKAPSPAKGLESDIFDIFLILMGRNPTIEEYRALLRSILDHWGIAKWEDLQILNHSHATKLQEYPECPDILKKPVLVKRLGYLVQCARCGVLMTTMTLK